MIFFIQYLLRMPYIILEYYTWTQCRSIRTSLTTNEMESATHVDQSSTSQFESVTLNWLAQSFSSTILFKIKKGHSRPFSTIVCLYHRFFFFFFFSKAFIIVLVLLMCNSLELCWLGIRVSITLSLRYYKNKK